MASLPCGTEAASLCEEKATDRNRHSLNSLLKQQHPLPVMGCTATKTSSLKGYCCLWWMLSFFSGVSCLFLVFFLTCQHVFVVKFKVTSSSAATPGPELGFDFHRRGPVHQFPPVKNQLCLYPAPQHRNSFPSDQNTHRCTQVSIFYN